MKMKRITFGLFLLIPGLALGADDWRMTAFTDAQRIVHDAQSNEAKVITSLNPETKAFYDLWLPIQDASRKLELIAFERRLKSNPTSIVFNTTGDLTEGVRSSDEKRALAKTDPEFKEAYEEFLALKAKASEQPELLKLRNAAYRQYHKEIMNCSKQLQYELDTLLESLDANK